MLSTNVTNVVIPYDGVIYHDAKKFKKWYTFNFISIHFD